MLLATWMVPSKYKGDTPIPPVARVALLSVIVQLTKLRVASPFACTAPQPVSEELPLKMQFTKTVSPCPEVLIAPATLAAFLWIWQEIMVIGSLAAMAPPVPVRAVLPISRQLRSVSCPGPPMAPPSVAAFP